MSHTSEEHFEVVKVSLPYVSGTCTIPEGVEWSQSYHTPLTCKEAGNSTWNYYFGTPNTPISFIEPESGHPIYRKIKSISETTAKLKGGGIASRPTASVSFYDFEGDPGPVNKTDSGTYFGKWAARNILAGREIEIQKYTLTDGVSSLVSTSVFVTDTYSVDKDGNLTLKCKSRLEGTYEDYTQHPVPTGATLRADIDAVTTSIPVSDEDYDWATLPIINIGGDLMVSTAYNAGTEILTVDTRTSGVPGISRTVNEEHDAGDDIQVCDVSDNEDVADFLERILLLSGVPSSYIDNAAWQAEFDDYWAGTTISNVWAEPTEVKNRIETLCNDFMLDIWENEVSPANIRLSAVSVWKEASKTIEVGRGITEAGFTFTGKPDSRASRAYIKFDKPFKTSNDDTINFKKVSVNIDETYEGPDFYDDIKEVEINPSELLTVNDADLRTQRHVARFNIEPVTYKWMCEEKYLDYKTGDIVEFKNRDLQDAEGNGASIRAQVTTVNPKYKYKGVGRAYSIEALTYSPAIISGGGEFTKVVSNSILTEIDINNNYADRTTQVVDFVLILDNCTVKSAGLGKPAIRNGAFTSGSTVTIICINGTDWQAASGKGGNGARWEYDGESSSWIQLTPAGDGGDGEICFNADGVNSVIWLSGATGNPSYPSSDGYLRASGGGGGGSGGSSVGDPGDGGGSGAGNEPLTGGAAGLSYRAGNYEYGEIGQDGDTLGNGGSAVDGGDGGDWGQDGQNGTGIGPGQSGLAGSGIIKSGATVVVNTAGARFINGNGDTPD